MGTNRDKHYDRRAWEAQDPNSNIRKCIYKCYSKGTVNLTVQIPTKTLVNLIVKEPHEITYKL